MIPIKPDSEAPLYDRFIENFCAKLHKWATSGFVGNRRTVSVCEAKEILRTLNAERARIFQAAMPKRWQQYSSSRKVKIPPEVMTAECRRLFRELAALMPEMAYADDAGLKRIIALLTRKYPDLSCKDSIIYRLVYKAFVMVGYYNKEFNKEELFEKANIRVCPYCNRVYIKNLRIENGKKVLRGELDHFYSKEKYPYLAISRYNLVPSCGFCNGPMGKSNADAIALGLVNPYSLSDFDGITFTPEFDGTIPMLTPDINRSVAIKFAYTNEALRSNAALFNLEELYATHSDIAAEIYLKHLSTSGKPYREFIARLTADFGMNLDPDVIFTLLYGVSNDRDRYADRPLSKFINDLVRYLDSISSPL